MTQQERDEIRSLVLSFSTKISDLPEVKVLTDSDYITVVQNDGSKKHSKKATLTSLLQLIKVYYPDNNGAKFQGIAHPEDNNVKIPVGTDGFWIAIDSGIYTNYGGIIVENSPKVIYYNVVTKEWSEDDLWGDINGTIDFRLKQGDYPNYLNTYRIPVVKNRTYTIEVSTIPSGSLGSIFVEEYNYNAELLNRTRLVDNPSNFTTGTNTDYIVVSLEYESSNPIDASMSHVFVSSSLKTLVEGIYNFLINVVQEEYESSIKTLTAQVSNITGSLEGINRRFEDDEGNIAELILTASSFRLRLSDAERNISTLEQTSQHILARVENSEGDIAQLLITSQEISTRVSNAEGDISTISQTADQIQATVSNVQGDVSRLTQRADGFELAVEDISGDVATLNLVAQSLDLSVRNAQGDIANLQYTAEGLQSTVQNIEGSVSTISQRADAIELGVSNNAGQISELWLASDQIGLRVSDAEDNVAQLVITSEQIETRVSNAEGNISLVSQKADEIKALVGDGDGIETSLTVDLQGVHSQITTITGDLSDYEEYVNGALQDIQHQLDGAIDTWFYNYAPVDDDEESPTYGELLPDVAPYSEWLAAETEEKPEAVRDLHVSDIFYNTNSGFAYRFIGQGEPGSRVYSWSLIEDSAVVKALADAAKAQDTADHKRRVFVDTPYPPYDIGDLWVQGHTENNDGDIYRCNNNKEAWQTFSKSDWIPASDFVKQKTVRANFDVLAEAIIGKVAGYDEDGNITSETFSEFKQTVGNIQLYVKNTKDGLLATGINIEDGDITLTANHVKLQNQSAVSGLELITIGSGANQRVVIGVDSINVAGLFVTQSWNEERLSLYNDTVHYASEYADTAVSYFNENVVAPLAGRVTSNESDLSVLNTYRTVMLNNLTIVAGGLILSTEIVLGAATGTGSTWQPWSGMSGVYDSTAGRGGGAAAWYGGTSLDAFTIQGWDQMTDEQKQTEWESSRYARTLFRHDGSGYLATGAITWGRSGDLHLQNNVYFGESTSQTVASVNAFLLKLASWFVDDTMEIGGVSRRVLRIAMNGTASGGTDFAGLVFDGMLITGGDQIVLSGTPGGGGEGASYLYELLDLSNTIIGKPSAQKILVFNPSGTDKNGNNGAWEYADMPTGSVTSIQVGSTTYNPVSGVVSLPAYPTSLPASDVYAWAKATTMPVATNSTVGGILIGYTQSGKNYPVQLSNNKAYVNVPWTDTNTTYSAGTGISLSGTTFSNSGVRATTINGNYLRVNTNGTNADLTIPYATSATSASHASKVVGSYTLNGGQQNPNYFGVNRVGFLMMSTTVNGNSQYKDWMIMDCYSGSDVGGSVAFGVNRQSLGAYIMRSAAARTSWDATAELYGTHNLTKSVITGLIGSTTYAPYNSAGYLPLSGGTITGDVYFSNETQGIVLPFPDASGKTALYKSGNAVYVGAIGNGTTSNIRLILRTRGADVYHRNGFTDYKMWDSGNDGAGSGLDADLLDGNNLITLVNDWNTSVTSIFKSSEQNAANAPSNTNLYGLHMRYHRAENIYFTDLVTEIYTDKLYFRRHTEQAYGDWKQIAFIDSNVASATKLATARTIWGHNFDGTENITGPLTQVNSIEFTNTSGNSYGGFLDFHYNGSSADYTSRIIEDASGRLTFGCSTAYFNGNVGIGTSSPAYKLDVAGVIASSGDQIITSDESKKTNIKDIKLSVRDIASVRAVTFDMKADGRHSFGTIAQDWLKILPEAVIGKEGDYSFAYAQAATVASTVNSREIVKIEDTLLVIQKHETEQDREIKRLKKRVRDLEKEVKRLRMN